MDWDSILTNALIVGAVTLVLGYLNRESNKETEASPSGVFLLRMSKLYQVLGLIACVMGLAMLVAVIIENDPELYWFGLPMAVAFILMGGWLLLYYQKHQVEVDENKIRVQNWRGKVVVLEWKEVEKISFNAFSGYIKVIGKDKKLTIHQHLVGLKNFVALMEQHTSWTAKALRIPVKMD